MALRIAAGKVEPSDLELELATSEQQALLSYAEQVGLLESELLATLTAREWQRVKARWTVQAAQQKVRTMLGKL